MTYPYDMHPDTADLIKTANQHFILSPKWKRSDAAVYIIHRYSQTRKIGSPVWRRACPKCFEESQGRLYFQGNEQH